MDNSTVNDDSTATSNTFDNSLNDSIESNEDINNEINEESEIDTTIDANMDSENITTDETDYINEIENEDINTDTIHENDTRMNDDTIDSDDVNGLNVSNNKEYIGRENSINFYSDLVEIDFKKNKVIKFNINPDDMDEHGRLPGIPIEWLVSALIIKPFERFDNDYHNKMIIMSDILKGLYESVKDIEFGIDSEPKLREIIDQSYYLSNIFEQYIKDTFVVNHSPKHYFMRLMRKRHRQIVFRAIRKFSY